MDALAVILEAPKRLSLRQLALTSVGPDDVVVDVRWSGISTGTEKLFWTGEMPQFPGMGYPLVPGYESVGRVVDAGEDAEHRIGDWVFVPGASCYTEARGLFGGTSQRVVIPSSRAHPVPESLGEDGTLLALAATAMHILNSGQVPELIVGHGVLGRLLARLTIATGAPAPTVWDINPARRAGASGYAVVAPCDDPRRNYGAIVDVSGNADGFDDLVARLAHGGEIALAGFYAGRVGFAFPPAFMREARLRVAAEWTPADLQAVRGLIDSDALSFDGLITDIRPASDAEAAYPAAFFEPDCLKMVLDWSDVA
ncbi:chlorophyll synthesis pathway protein BchC [Sphingomonas jaspsi]|uniref:chlorophyll synthesis pathway protein BchC n=1 Tax=Sphingomonas jaspsi TaxID=392409 RepID=UPI0005698F8B|nr:chlorophyll synthesis pathway protein BchC [Sphingomonas jaspsi]